jgi:hypothetical protein
MKIFKATIITVLGSLALLSGCGDQLPTDIPDPYGVQGYLDLGWESYAAADYEQALDYFKVAIDLDVSGVEGFLGAGWAALFVEDYWRVADDYFYMAIQHDAGAFPMLGLTETQLQDTMWTNFVCLHPQLPPEVLDPILEMTADSGALWVGDQINAIIGNKSIQYKFQAMGGDAISMFDIHNGFSNATVLVDSIVDGWVYVTVPRKSVVVGDDTWRTWINVGNGVDYSYRTFEPTGTESQYTYDALTGIVMLQDIRGTNGDPILGAAAAMALDQLTGDYSFGNGMDYEGLENLSNVQIIGNGAAIGFSQEAFLYCWSMCKSVGYGAELDPESDTFETDLMVVIENMLNS